VVALPKSSALGQSTKSLPRNTLLRRTRAELFGLHRDSAAALAAMPDSDPERPVALTNLRNIRRVLKAAEPCPLVSRATLDRRDPTS
jgi:hypothetical protein